jgi:hypothetical protein
VLEVREVGVSNSKVVYTQAKSNIPGGVAEEAGGGCLDIVTRVQLGEEA